jgi:hypothetical protein
LYRTVRLCNSQPIVRIEIRIVHFDLGSVGLNKRVGETKTGDSGPDLAVKLLFLRTDFSGGCSTRGFAIWAFATYSVLKALA